jgi:hypothetical protein
VVNRQELAGLPDADVGLTPDQHWADHLPRALLTSLAATASVIPSSSQAWTK